MRIQFACLLLLATLTPTSAIAAESYDNCTGFIDSLPATIATQGTWCLRKDLATSMTSGNAIEIKTNNVTIDCNDFKIGGLAAGPGTSAYGIFASEKLNITVRNCSIRGFWYGIVLYGGPGNSNGGGHVIEDNRLDANTDVGMNIEGDGSVVRRNLVRDTGGSTLSQAVYAMTVSGDSDVIDNTVAGVGPGGYSPSNSWAHGIYLVNNGGSIRGNRVRGLIATGVGTAYGINSENYGRRPVLRDNDVTGPGNWGVHCNSSQAVARDNIVSGFDTGITGCSDDGNVATP